MESRQIEFLEVYKNSNNAKEARAKYHISAELVSKWIKNDSEFSCEYKRIEHENRTKSKMKSINEDEYKERIEVFFEKLKDMPVLNALSIARISTHKFMDLKRNNSEFRKRYEQAKRNVGFNNSTFSQRLEKEERTCPACGRTLPLSSFLVSFNTYNRRLNKRCAECVAKAKQTCKENKQKKHSKEYREIKLKLKQIESEMRNFSEKLEFDNFISSRREYDIYKRKLESLDY